MIRPRLAGSVLAVAALALVASEARAQSWSDFQSARTLQGEGSLRAQVKYGAGRFLLQPIDTGHLYRMRLRYDEETFAPLHTFRNGRLEVGVEGEGRRWGSSLRLSDSEAELEISLSRRVPIDLTLELGAVVAEIDLGGLHLTGLDVSLGASDSRIRVSEPNPGSLDRVTLKVGAASFSARELGNLNAREIRVEAGIGEVTLDFTGLTREETRVDAKMGLGSLEVRIPAGVGIEVHRSTFLASVNAPGLTRRGNLLHSANWESAPTRIRIRVESVLGSVSIVTIP